MRIQPSQARHIHVPLTLRNFILCLCRICRYFKRKPHLPALHVLHHCVHVTARNVEARNRRPKHLKSRGWINGGLARVLVVDSSAVNVVESWHRRTRRHLWCLYGIVSSTHTTQHRMMIRTHHCSLQVVDDQFALSHLHFCWLHERAKVDQLLVEPEHRVVLVVPMFCRAERALLSTPHHDSRRPAHQQ
jgi:hypothetical protein